MPQLSGASHASSYATQPISSHTPCQRRSAFQQNGSVEVKIPWAELLQFEVLICHCKSPQTKIMQDMEEIYTHRIGLDRIYSI